MGEPFLRPTAMTSFTGNHPTTHCLRTSGISTCAYSWLDNCANRMHLSTGQLQMDTTLWFRRICVWQPITLTSQAYQSEDAPYPVLNCTHCFCPLRAMEQVAGFEPACPAWRAGVLTPIRYLQKTGEPSLSPAMTSV